MLWILIRLYPIKNYYWVYDTEKTPYLAQYINSLKAIFTKFDWGFCTTLGPLYMPVTEYLWTKMQFTLYITGVAMVIALLVGTTLGTLFAFIKRKAISSAFYILFMALGSIPIFVWAYFLQYVICFKLELLPLYFPPGYDFFSWHMFKNAIIPISCLAFAPTASYMYTLRASLLESLSSDYVMLLRVKGLTTKQIILRHSFRNAIITIFPQIYANIIVVSTSSFIIERIFAIPGASYTFMRSFSALDRNPNSEWLMPKIPGTNIIDLGVIPDYAVFMILAMFYVGIAIVSGILFDIAYGLMDPRIRVGSKKN